MVAIWKGQVSYKVKPSTITPPLMGVTGLVSPFSKRSGVQELALVYMVEADVTRVPFPVKTVSKTVAAVQLTSSSSLKSYSSVWKSITH